MFSGKYSALSAAIVITSSGMGYNMHAAGLDAPAVKLINEARPLVIAHRGFSEFAPENTLPSFKLAMAAGADLVELDYYHSKDGHPFVFHDGTLDRTTDATNKWNEKKIRVDSKTLVELKSLDAGSWFSPLFKDTRIPTLNEALDFIQSGGVTLIERKAGDAATCVKVLRDKGLVNQLVVQSFDWSYLKAFHELEPTQVLGALGPPSTLTDGTKPDKQQDKALNSQWLDGLAKTGAKLVVWSDKVSRESVRLAQQRGFKVWVYTINDADAANRLLDMGVDGIITNNPSLIWRTIALRSNRT